MLWLWGRFTLTKCKEQEIHKFFFFLLLLPLKQTRRSLLLHCALLILKPLHVDNSVMWATPASNLPASLVAVAKSKGTVTKWQLTYFCSFFPLYPSSQPPPLYCRSTFLSDLLCQRRKILSAKKKMLIITSEIGNCIRINKDEITVIMVGLMGSACIIKGRMQRNNTDPLGCAAAPFSLKQGRHVRASAASASTEFILFLMALKYTYRPVLWSRDHKGAHMLLYIIQITVETALKGSTRSTPFSFWCVWSSRDRDVLRWPTKHNKCAPANVLFMKISSSKQFEFIFPIRFIIVHISDQLLINGGLFDVMRIYDGLSETLMMFQEKVYSSA